MKGKWKELKEKVGQLIGSNSQGAKVTFKPRFK